MSNPSDKWDKKDKKMKDGVLKEFAKYNLEATCPFCSFRRRMREKFDQKTVEDLVGDKEHDAKQCFQDEFMLHQIMYPRKEEKYQNMSDDDYRNMADKRFNAIVDLIRASKK